MITHLCVVDYVALDDRDDCPNTLHDWPLPYGCIAAHEVAMSRIYQGWGQRRCPDCHLYGWTAPPKEMRGKAKNPVRVSAPGD